MDEEILVVDVTSEVIGERREEWRDGYEAGIKRGVNGYLNSPVTEQLALELTVLRTFVGAMNGAAEQHERLVAHWKAEAEWWREEHDRVSREFSEFVALVKRRFP